MTATLARRETIRRRSDAVALIEPTSDDLLEDLRRDPSRAPFGHGLAMRQMLQDLSSELAAPDAHAVRDSADLGPDPEPCGRQGRDEAGAVSRPLVPELHEQISRERLEDRDVLGR
jgi:hypothetical protein